MQRRRSTKTRVVMSVQLVVDLFNLDKGVNLGARSIQRAAREGQTDLPRKKRGPNLGVLQEDIFNLLIEAFQTYIELYQANGKGWNILHNRALLSLL